MKNAEKKQLAKSLFIAGSMTRKDIAKQVIVAEKTLRGWIDDGGWEALKEIQSVTRSQLLLDAYAQLAAINKKIREEFENVPTKELSDAKGVIRKEIETLSSNPLHIYVEVFEQFFDHIAKRHPKDLQMVNSHAMELMEILANSK